MDCKVERAPRDGVRVRRRLARHVVAVRRATRLAPLPAHGGPPHTMRQAQCTSEEAHPQCRLPPPASAHAGGSRCARGAPRPKPPSWHASTRTRCRRPTSWRASICTNGWCVLKTSRRSAGPHSASTPYTVGTTSSCSRYCSALPCTSRVSRSSEADSLPPVSAGSSARCAGTRRMLRHLRRGTQRTRCWSTQKYPRAYSRRWTSLCRSGAGRASERRSRSRCRRGARGA